MSIDEEPSPPPSGTSGGATRPAPPAGPAGDTSLVNGHRAGADDPGALAAASAAEVVAAASAEALAAASAPPAPAQAPAADPARELAITGLVDPPSVGETGDKSDISAPAADDKPPTGHPYYRHWMPWILILSATALPLLCYAAVASLPSDSLQSGGFGESVGHGDFLVPVLAMYAEAMRTWWGDAKCRRLTGVMRALCTGLCTIGAVICLITIVVSLVVTRTDLLADSVKTVTLACFTSAFFSGTLAVWISRPGRKQQTRAERKQARADKKQARKQARADKKQARADINKARKNAGKDGSSC